MEFASLPPGVNEDAAAGQDTATDAIVTTENETQDETTTETGVDEGDKATTETPENPVAGDEVKFDEKTESAFAKRLAAERTKIEKEATRKTTETEASLKARDTEVARRFGQQGITTWEQLVSGWDAAQRHQQVTVQDQRFQTEVQRLATELGADPETISQVVQRLLPHHPLAAKATELEQQFGQVRTEQQKQAQFLRQGAELKAAYPDLDVQTIPDEVFKMNQEQGVPLLTAYRVHESTQLREKVASLEKALQVKETNKKNATNSPGSVTGQGATVADYISAETFEKNKGDQRWIIKNLSKIQESRTKWK